MTPKGRVVSTGWLVALAACTVSGDQGNTFGGSSVSVSVGTSMTASASAGTESGTGDESGSTAGSSSSTGGEESSSGGVDTTASASSEGASVEGSSSGGGMQQQPEDGMYSHCLMPAECVGVNLCITVMPNGQMEPETGFCTSTGCSDPAADCLPNPGGTATPICYPVTVNMMAQEACALDCSGGKTCPAPMTCWTLADGQICA